MNSSEQLNYNQYLLDTIYHILAFKSKEIFVDLHTHSSYSDGELDPYDLINFAIKNEINTLGITDHNTVEGVIDGINFITKFDKSLKDRFFFIPGIELSTDFNGHLIDITGFFIDIYARKLNELLKRIINGHLEKAKLQLEKLEKSGINIGYDNYIKFLDGHVPNWKTMAEALVHWGYAKDINEAKEKYTNRGKSGYVDYNENWSKIDISEAIISIRKADGISFIAHLGDVEKMLGLDLTKRLILSLKKLGLSGLDLSNRGRLHSNPSNEILQFIREEDLITIIGSDFHSWTNEKLNGFQIDKNIVDRLALIKTKSYTNLYKEKLELLSFQDLRFFPIQIIPENIFTQNIGIRDLLIANKINNAYELSSNLENIYEKEVFLKIWSNSLSSIFKNIENEIFLKEILLKMDSYKLKKILFNRLKSTQKITITENTTSEQKEFLIKNIKTYLPIAYRLCFYDLGLRLKEESIRRLSLKKWNELNDEYSKIINNVFNLSVKDLEKYIEDKKKEIASLLSSQGYHYIEIQSRVKPLTSFYEKLRISYFVGYNHKFLGYDPKIVPSSRLSKTFLKKFLNFRKGLLSQDISKEEFGSYCEDLIGFRIILENDDESIKYDAIINTAKSLIKHPNIVETKPRKWHHNRLIVWGFDDYFSTELPVEIQLMKWTDYLLARAYYWYPKGIQIFPEIFINKKLEERDILKSRLRCAEYDDLHKIMIEEIKENIFK